MSSEIWANHRNNPNKRIKQDFVVAGGQGKLDKLTEILIAEAENVGGRDKMRRTLVFVNTKRISDMAVLYIFLNVVFLLLQSMETVDNIFVSKH